MDIYQSMEMWMLRVDKSINPGGGHVSAELQGVCEIIALAWDKIPREWQERLYNAAMRAARHFGLTLDRQYAPRPWLVALMNLYEGTEPKIV